MSSRHRALLRSAMTSSFCLRIKTAYLILISPRFLKSGDWCTGCDFLIKKLVQVHYGRTFLFFFAHYMYKRDNNSTQVKNENRHNTVSHDSLPPG